MSDGKSASRENRRTVLITGVRAPAALELCRQFDGAGWRVLAADCLLAPLGRFSRSVDRYHRVPPPRQQPTAFRAAVARIVREEKVELVVPTCEEVFHLAPLREEEPEVAPRLFCPPLEQLRQLHHKRECFGLLDGLGADGPQCRSIRNGTELTDAFQRWPELVLKPAYSRFACRTLVRPVRAQAAQALAEPGGGEWVAQPFLRGQEFCSYSVARAGRLLAHACYQPLLRAGLGAGVYFEPVRDEAIRAFAAAAAGRLNFTGQLGFDFIRTEDGRLHVIECNPRATSGVHLFHDSRLARAIGDNEPAEPGDRPAMIGAAVLLVAGRQWLELERPLAAWRAARDVTWAAGDPGPSLSQGAGLAENVAITLRHRIGLRAATTHSLEWNGPASPSAPSSP